MFHFCLKEILISSERVVRYIENIFYLEITIDNKLQNMRLVNCLYIYANIKMLLILIWNKDILST